MSSVARAVWLARLFTSCATTAKPRPASPARAASIVALSASRLVCPAMSRISPRIDFDRLGVFGQRLAHADRLARLRAGARSAISAAASTSVRASSIARISPAAVCAASRIATADCSAAAATSVPCRARRARSTMRRPPGSRMPAPRSAVPSIDRAIVLRNSADALLASRRARCAHRRAARRRSSGPPRPAPCAAPYRAAAAAASASPANARPISAIVALCETASADCSDASGTCAVARLGRRAAIAISRHSLAERLRRISARHSRRCVAIRCVDARRREIVAQRAGSPAATDNAARSRSAIVALRPLAVSSAQISRAARRAMRAVPIVIAEMLARRCATAPPQPR